MKPVKTWGGLTAVFFLALTAGCATKPAVIREKAGQEPTNYSHAVRLARCGVERWSVKTGTDPDAPSVDLRRPEQETVEYLTSVPKQSPLPSDNRLRPTETTEYVVDATLVGYKLESKDSDYHLVIQGGDGQTMIVEIPAPACVGPNSPFAAEIKNARDEFDLAYHATTTYKRVSVPVRVRGVGFFDFNHGQTGVSKTNAIELHPVLDILFNP
ncbi:MAG TPA: hypothetical protein VGN24_06470 [Rhodanobacter sp.]|jgi:hypothetical protein|nr:hypothetical protein [Rhodanobacter sp.]